MSDSSMGENKKVFYAHSANGGNKWHPLSEHLICVSRLASKFSAVTAWADEARLAGVLHDLGKYGDRFQARLNGDDHGLDHWSQGASVALDKFKAVAAALAIQGHHIGLQRGNKNSLLRLVPANLSQAVLPGLDLSDADIERLQSRATTDGLEFSKPTSFALNSWSKAVAAMLDVRLLFSCLVDADFLDTEAHFNGDAKGKLARPPGPTLDASAALSALDKHMTALRVSGNAEGNVNQARETLWSSVTRASQENHRLFTLTAPTGSGKTLAMLKFALEHANKYGLKRIIVVVPFLTVIEQTARTYRAVLKGSEGNFVLEHHSMAGLGVEAEQQDAEGANERQRRLLADNWDAPVVLTTNVQLLESLFSNRPSACRKLHNLMGSIILFDEAQSLPTNLAVPTLAALSHLADSYRTSVVFATATQPAFDSLHDEVKKHAIQGWQPYEAVPEHPALFAALERVTVRWPEESKEYSWDDLANELRGSTQALVIVNLKRHALNLLAELQGTEGVFHLSTNLCAEHRRAVLNRVRKQLKSGKPCRLISTQCIEAGVDLDFPLVYRALAPLEAIAQAAGRCNREGRLKEKGTVIVFEPNEEGNWRRRYPTHSYYQAAEVTRKMLTQHGKLDINDPALFREYYRQLYDLNDPSSQNQALSDAITALDFVEVARCYRIIDKSAIQVLVPWGDRWEEFDALRTEADRQGISANWMRRAQGLAVSVYRTSEGTPAWAIPAKLRRGGASGEWFILEGDFYDDTLGLNPPKGEQVFIA
jgi:CRISPR-associated endonuclease/helicase Cas3